MVELDVDIILVLKQSPSGRLILLTGDVVEGLHLTGEEQ
jgi:hypothetical protein